MKVFANDLDNADHFALIKECPSSHTHPPLIRIHSECITGDVFGSQKCDCGHQLQQSMGQIDAQGGVLIYLRQEGRGIGLADKIKAYSLQEQGYDTVEANVALGHPPDARCYAVASQILRHLGITRIHLLTNNSDKIAQLERYGIRVVKRIPLLTTPTHQNVRYLHTKKKKMGHFLRVSQLDE